ncbi:hypothetical protein GJ744_008144 [Endocarpon pusillum]|uniref:Mid2 domain-containing protein n=1 Tax=Endocarpon pusillum TaxID=364733 RepID=A0A8H7AHJ7_9EURO|nr:hypothetical protein GJ744_008144 [Endocarpon pusillum]
MATCWRKSRSKVESRTGVDVPCPNTRSPGGFDSCCYNGDLCLGDSICHYTHSLAGGSGYYTQGCSDPTYQDSACFQRCTDQALPDVIYNPTTALWACCSTLSDGAISCLDPTNETFQAASPEALLSSTSISASSAATTVPFSASSSPAVDKVFSSLSTGAKTGIGVGAGIGLVIVLTLLVWAITATKKLRKMRRPNSSAASPYDDSHGGNSGYKAELHAQQKDRAELYDHHDVNKRDSKNAGPGSTTVYTAEAHELNA